MTTHFLGGVTNVSGDTTLGHFIAPDPTAAHVWFDDFNSFTAGQWTITTTEAGAGSASEAIGPGAGGILVITNDAADNDNDFLQWTSENFRWSAGKAMWYKARFKVSDATESDLTIGLQITDTTPLDVTDGLFFSKADGSTSLIFNAEKNNTASTVTVANLQNDTFITVGFHYDPDERVVNLFVNDERVGRLTTLTNMPDDEDLAVSFGIQNGEAVSKVLSLDYIFVASQR